MSEPWGIEAQSRALWRRWIMREGLTGSEAADLDLPDAMTLAAYAEGRLDAAARAAVEGHFADHPELAEDIAMARRVAGEELVRADDAPELAAIIARASALAPERDNVVAFRPARAEPAWRLTARWSALAASLAMVSYLGFALGNDASSSLAMLGQPASAGLAEVVLDPPTGLLGGLGEMSGT